MNPRTRSRLLKRSPPGDGSAPPAAGNRAAQVEHVALAHEVALRIINGDAAFPAGLEISARSSASHQAHHVKNRESQSMTQRIPSANVAAIGFVRAERASLSFEQESAAVVSGGRTRPSTPSWPIQHRRYLRFVDSHRTPPRQLHRVRTLN
jgi:hypothetical protein